MGKIERYGSEDDSMPNEGIFITMAGLGLYFLYRYIKWSKNEK